MHRAVRWFGKPYFVKGQDWAKENCTSENSIFEGSGGEFSGSGIQSGSRIIPVIPEIGIKY